MWAAHAAAAQPVSSCGGLQGQQRQSRLPCTGVRAEYPILLLPPQKTVLCVCPLGHGRAAALPGLPRHPGLRDTGCVLTRARPSPRRSAASPGRRGGHAGDADADAPRLTPPGSGEVSPDSFPAACGDSCCQHQLPICETQKKQPEIG